MMPDSVLRPFMHLLALLAGALPSRQSAAIVRGLTSTLRGAPSHGPPKLISLLGRVEAGRPYDRRSQIGLGTCGETRPATRR